MNNSNNLTIKVFISVCVIFALVQSRVTKLKNEELDVIKNELSSLQATIDQKELEIKQITSKNLEEDAKLESERNLMSKEIEELKEKVDKNTSYIESNLSSLSQEIIEKQAQKVIRLIKEKDFKGLSKEIHPANGLTLSSTPEIKISHSTIISKDTVANWKFSDKQYKWGVLDGEGNQIELTLEEYYNLYIYDIDYANEAEISYNKNIERAEGKKVNIYEVYNEGIVVEYFFKGTKENNFVDWKSIYLCFERYNNAWYLSAIIHS